MIYVLIIGLGDMKKAIASASKQLAKKIVLISEDSLTDRKYAARNIWDSLNHTFKGGKDDDVVALLDGDDELVGVHALDPIMKAYQNQSTWLTYGSYEYASDHRRGAFNGMYLRKDIRKRRWHATHLKTFRYGLWRHLPESALKGPDGNWLQVCSDTAVMFPMIEMAGLDRTRYIKQVIYRYNDLNPLNDHKTRGAEQLATDKWIRSQKPFERLESW
ncbi:MAG: hypothetical protein IMZ70_08000 [Candidatus Atribacteria bacterium]|nr:hypothetical protein [Candidatus Atribacteria bacterium]MBE3122185.1 hypothetical protein [Thermoplasmata archaeon]MBE3139221.1 hypothetical protein [Thermoplasmata archaeon]